MQLVSYGLLAGCILLNWHKPRLGLQNFTLPILLLGFMVVFTWIQYLPLPGWIIQHISPFGFEHQHAAQASRFSISLDPAQTLITFYKCLSFWSLFLVALLLINSPKRLRLTMLSMLLAGALQALYGSIEVLSGIQQSLIFSYPVSNAATGSFVYSNHFANFLVLTTAMGLGHLIGTLKEKHSPDRREFLRSILNSMFNGKAIVRITIAMMVIALVLSRSRMGNSAFFLALGISGLAGLILFRRKTRSLTWLIVSMLVIDLLIVSSWFGLEKVKTRLVETNFAEEVRLNVWQSASDLLNLVPLFGVGGGSFYSVFPMFQDPESQYFYDHAHNDYLQFTIEYGILSTAVLATFIGLSLYQCSMAMWIRRDRTMVGAAFACQMALIGMLICMSSDFPLQSPANAAYFIVILAMAWIVRKLPRHTPP